MVSMSRIALFTAVLANSAAAFRPAATRAARRGLTVAAYDIQGTVASADVVVFSKSYCPFCDKTKRVFRNLEVDATIVELDQLDEGDAIQADLAEMTGQRTVPSVFIKGTHIGGNDDTQQALASGKLEEMLGV